MTSRLFICTALLTFFEVSALRLVAYPEIILHAIGSHYQVFVVMITQGVYRGGKRGRN
ncbi:hypothetical protein F5880DRAFT_1588908 [Lentinula raphanica]|nr:hypothetical protein F5880DRAFT_1588908 [Lentinula raphanica]